MSLLEVAWARKRLCEPGKVCISWVELAWVWYKLPKSKKGSMSLIEVANSGRRYVGLVDGEWCLMPLNICHNMPFLWQFTKGLIQPITCNLLQKGPKLLTNWACPKSTKISIWCPLENREKCLQKRQMMEKFAILVVLLNEVYQSLWSPSSLLSTFLEVVPWKWWEELVFIVFKTFECSAKREMRSAPLGNCQTIYWQMEKCP